MESIRSVQKDLVKAKRKRDHEGVKASQAKLKYLKSELEKMGGGD